MPLWDSTQSSGRALNYNSILFLIYATIFRYFSSSNLSCVYMAIHLVKQVEPWSWKILFCKFMIMRRYKITEHCIKLRYKPFLVVSCKREKTIEENKILPCFTHSHHLRLFFLIFMLAVAYENIFPFFCSTPCNAQNVVNKEFFSFFFM